MSFPRALGFTARWEGGFSDDELDPGGRTNVGITEASYQDWLRNPEADVLDITPDQVVSFYRGWWNRNGCVGYDQLDERMGILMFDASVQHGGPMAIRFLQRALGGLTDDGVFGRLTFNRMHDVYEATPQTLLDDLVSERKAHYIARSLAPGMIRWLHGWLGRVEDCGRVADAHPADLDLVVRGAHDGAKLPMVLPGIP